MKSFTNRELAMTALMTALVYLASAFLSIPIPTALGMTRIHLGNVLCLLSGMLLGYWKGGLAAGLGSMLFDLTNPMFIVSAPLTFIFKFAMAWICGWICALPGKSIKVRLIEGSIAGSLSYVFLYLLKNFLDSVLVVNMPMQGVWMLMLQKGSVSLINAAIACLIAVPLGAAMLHSSLFSGRISSLSKKSF